MNLPRVRLPRFRRPVRLPVGIRRPSVVHVLVLAYMALLVGFVIVVLDRWE